jgi:nucleoside 2-deoxyribosyltransferase
MNIYFSCSITGGRAEEKTYQAIVKELLDRGHEVPTAHLSSPNVMEMENVVDPVEIFNRDMNWLRECDAVVAEVSSPSHGVGYEVAYALTLKKPVFCCYKRGKKVSKIITGNTSPGLKVAEYENDDEALKYLCEFLEFTAGNHAQY